MNGGGNLQMVNDAQTRLIPQRPKELIACAHRLGYADNDCRHTPIQFLRNCQHHTSKVNCRSSASLSRGVSSNRLAGRQGKTKSKMTLLARQTRSILRIVSR